MGDDRYAMRWAARRVYYDPSDMNAVGVLGVIIHDYYVGNPDHEFWVKVRRFWLRRKYPAARSIAAKLILEWAYNR